MPSIEVALDIDTSFLAAQRAARKRLWEARSVPKVIEPAEPTEQPTEPAAKHGMPVHSLELVARKVADRHQLPINAIRARGRAKKAVLARQEFCYLAALETLHSIPSISRWLGGRNHTTTLYHIACYCLDHDLSPPRGSTLNIASRRRRK